MQTANDLIATLARELVADLSPRELPLFKAVSSAYFKDPEEVFRHARGGEKALGFGEAGAASALTPFVLAATGAVIAYVAQTAAAAQADPAKALALPSEIKSNRAWLMARIGEGFSIGELKTLCFTLDLDYSQFTGESTPASDFVRELILFCERRNRMDDLIQACAAERPGVAFRPAPKAALLKWSSDQLKHVREIVLQTAKRLSVTEDAGTTLADSLVLSLVAA